MKILDETKFRCQRKKGRERDSSLFSGWTMPTWFESMSFFKLLDLNCGDLATRPWLRWGSRAQQIRKDFVEAQMEHVESGSMEAADQVITRILLIRIWEVESRECRWTEVLHVTEVVKKASSLLMYNLFWVTALAEPVSRTSFDDPLEPQKMC